MCDSIPPDRYALIVTEPRQIS